MLSFTSTLTNIFYNSNHLRFDIPQLWQEIIKFSEKEESSSKLKLSLQTGKVICRVTTIAMNITKLFANFKSNDSLISSEQQESLKKFLIKLRKIDVIAKSFLLVDDFIKSELSNKEWFLNINNWFVASDLIFETLYVKKIIGDSSLIKFEYGQTIARGGLSLYTLEKNPEMLESFYDFCLFQYDRYFVSHPLDSIPLRRRDLVDVDTDQLSYDGIPNEHKRNYVFRKFKDSISKNCIRYPVVVVDPKTKKPLTPIKFFERKNLVMILSANPTYPGTDKVIQLNQIKEHLIARKLIEQELKKLKLI